MLQFSYFKFYYDFPTWLHFAQLSSNVVIEESIEDRIDAGWSESDEMTDNKVQQVAVTCEEEKFEMVMSCVQHQNIKLFTCRIEYVRTLLQNTKYGKRKPT